MSGVVRLFWNLFVPVLVAGLFNVVGGMAHFGASAPISPSDLDISFGCAFAIVGVASAQKDMRAWRRAYGLFIVALLSSLLFDIILRYRLPALEWRMVASSDGVSLIAAGYAMWTAGEVNG